MGDSRDGFTLRDECNTTYNSKHSNSHQEKCKKYKRQIEELKLDKLELYEKIADLEKQITKLKRKGQQ